MKGSLFSPLLRDDHLSSPLPSVSAILLTLDTTVIRNNSLELIKFLNQYSLIVDYTTKREGLLSRAHL